MNVTLGVGTKSQLPVTEHGAEDSLPNFRSGDFPGGRLLRQQ